MSEPTHHRSAKEYDHALVSVLMEKGDDGAWVLEEIAGWISAGRSDEEIRGLLRERGARLPDAIDAGLDRAHSWHILRVASAKWREGAADAPEVVQAEERLKREMAIRGFVSGDAVQRWLVAHGASAELAAHLASSPAVQRSTKSAAVFLGVIGLLIGLAGLIFGGPLLPTAFGFALGVVFLLTAFLSRKG